MTDFHTLAFDALPDADRGAAQTATDLSSDQVLRGVQRYYVAAAEGWESHWREQLSTLVTTPPLAAALIAAEWLVKGPEALRVLAGGDSDIIATEAQIISAFNPAAPVTPADVAADVATRFSFWVAGGMILTALRRAAQRRIAAQTTPEACAAAFALMRAAADEVIGLAQAGATKEAVMERLVERAGALQ